MTTRPTVSPLFATDATLGTGVESALTPRLDPGAGVRARGLLPNTRVPARWLNFLRGLLGDWVQYLDEKSDWAFNPKNFGATGLGVADDTTAIQNALNAAGAITGGAVVVIGAGTYRLIAALSVPAGVSIVARGTVTFMKDHASNKVLVWSSASGKPVTVEDIRIEGAQNNTGSILEVTAAVTVTLVRCLVNVADDKLKGQILLSTSSGSKFAFHQCQANMKGTVAVGISGLGAVEIVGGEYSVPSNYAATSFTAIDITRCYGAKFTQLLSTTGDFGFIYANDAVVQGCVFRVTDNGAPALTYAIAIGGGSKIVSSGNDFGSHATNYCFPCKGTGPAARGSVIQLISSAYQTTGGGTLNLQNDRYESITVRYTGTSPTLQLSAPKVEGQKLYLTVVNTSGGTLGFGVNGYNLKAAQPTPVNNAGAAALFVATDPTDSGTPSWSQVGDWASIAA